MSTNWILDAALSNTNSNVAATVESHAAGSNVTAPVDIAAAAESGDATTTKSDALGMVKRRWW